MGPDHLTFFIVLTAPLLAVLWADRRRIRDYAALGLLAVLLDLVWDPVGMAAGLWQYSSQPQVMGMSVYMLLLYFHFMSFCYFIGNRAGPVLGRRK